jgi:hypothetical protein
LAIIFIWSVFPTVHFGTILNSRRITMLLAILYHLVSVSDCKHRRHLEQLIIMMPLAIIVIWSVFPTVHIGAILNS